MSTLDDIFDEYEKLPKPNAIVLHESTPAELPNWLYKKWKRAVLKLAKKGVAEAVAIKEFYKW